MFGVVITSVRPDISIDFFRYDHDIYEYIEKKFIETGKLINQKISVSEDLTTETHNLIFTSKADWIEYFKDPVLDYHKKVKSRYNTFNKIAVSMNADEIVITKDLYNLYLR